MRAERTLASRGQIHVKHDNAYLGAGVCSSARFAVSSALACMAPSMWQIVTTGCADRGYTSRCYFLSNQPGRQTARLSTQ